MEKVYNINVNGRIAMQNVTIEEENATKECLLYMLSDIGANEEEKALKEEIDNGATVEFEEVEKRRSGMIIKQRCNGYNTEVVDDDIFYAVQEDSTDAWDWGSENFEEAAQMLRRQGHGQIAVVRVSTEYCLDTIDYSEVKD